MGRLPNHRLCPAFRSLRAPWLGLETIPIVARHRESMSFSTPEGSRLFTLLQPIQIPNRISWREVQKLSL